MALLSASEIADMRATALEFLDSEAGIYPRTLTTDDHYAQKEVFNFAFKTACRLDLQQPKPTQKDAIEGGAVRQQEVFHLSLPVCTQIQESDRVKIGDTFYSVISSLDDRSWAAVKRLLVRRV